jgi:hypothetical protein
MTTIIPAVNTGIAIEGRQAAAEGQMQQRRVQIRAVTALQAWEPRPTMMQHIAPTEHAHAERSDTRPRTEP